jgi:hypothetical protein
MGKLKNSITSQVVEGTSFLFTSFRCKTQNTMATSKEFNRLFDLAQKETDALRNAEQLAYSLGFNANYCDGVRMQDFDYQVKQICKILGVKSRKEWPSSVEESYKDGAHEGYLET